MTTDYVVSVYLGIMGYREKYHQIMKRGFKGQRSQARAQPEALLFFEDPQSAARAQVELLEMGHPVGKYLMVRSYPRTFQAGNNNRGCTIAPACGWENVEEGDLFYGMEHRLGPRLRTVYVTQPGQLKTEARNAEEKPQAKSRKAAKKNQREEGSGTEGSGKAAGKADTDDLAVLARKYKCTTLSRKENEYGGIDEVAAWEPRDNGDQLTMADEMELS